MINLFKTSVDFLSAPTISFTILTVLFPFVFPPTDWFDKINRKLKIYKMWSRTGNIVALILITFFFVVGYFDPNFNITLTKADNFPIVLMVYTMWYFTWLAMHKAYINDGRLEKD